MHRFDYYAISEERKARNLAMYTELEKIARAAKYVNAWHIKEKIHEYFRESTGRRKG